MYAISYKLYKNNVTKTKYDCRRLVPSEKLNPHQHLNIIIPTIEISLFIFMCECVGGREGMA